MAAPSLTQHYTIKEFQLLVKDSPVVPAEIQPFVGISFRRSDEVYQTFRQLAEMPVETFLVLHLDSKNRMVGMTTCSIGSMTASLVHPRDVFKPAIAKKNLCPLKVHIWENDKSKRGKIRLKNDQTAVVRFIPKLNLTLEWMNVRLVTTKWWRFKRFNQE